MFCAFLHLDQDGCLWVCDIYKYPSLPLKKKSNEGDKVQSEIQYLIMIFFFNCLLVKHLYTKSRKL